MRIVSTLIAINAFLLCTALKPVPEIIEGRKKKTAIIVRSRISEDEYWVSWRKALKTRMNPEDIEVMYSKRRVHTPEEKLWIKLIEDKAMVWNKFRDSIGLPFPGVKMEDTIYILPGYLGKDDGFTYGFNTVCLDVTALHSVYGSADNPENIERIDRLFAHEYTHLLHKVWAKKNDLKLTSFKDDILWECIYEGIGMYRSLTSKWKPQNGILPELTKNTLKELYPVFVDNLIKVLSDPHLPEEEKKKIGANLSRGSVPKKWGALPMAIWLALESGGDDKRLASLINKGPEAVLILATKYLDGEAGEKWRKYCEPTCR